MAKFVLVHGAGHGAWCWYKVVSRLSRVGHSVVAVDLSSAGINGEDPNQLRTLAHYSRPLIEFLESLPDGEKVVIVGHSLGGITLTYVMEKFPSKCAAAVFVAAFMLTSGLKGVEIRQKAMAHSSNRANYFDIDGSEVPTSAKFKLEVVDSLLYHLSPSEDVELARLLLKPIPLLPPHEIGVEFTKENYGSVPRFYIKAMHDRIILPVSQDLFLENNPPDQVIEIASDHSPFFSAPDALADALASIASKVAP